MIPLLASVSRGDGGGSSPSEGYSAEVLADSPTHYWRLNEASGTIIDSGSAGNDSVNVESGVTYSGPALVSGSGAASIELDGASNGIRFGDIGTDNDGTKTVEAVVVPDDFATQQVIFKEGGQNNGYAIGFGGGDFRVGVASTSGANFNLDIDLSGYSVGDTLHLAVVFDATAGEIRGYINGTLAGSLTGITIPSHDGTCHAFIGSARCDTGGTYQSPITRSSDASRYDGKVAEVAVYRGVALSAARIAAHAALIA